MLTDDDKQWLERQLKKLKEYIDDRTHDAETRLLRAFSDYNIASDVRMRKLEADTSNIDASTTKRLGELERRVTEMDIRIIRLEGREPPARLPQP
jgi:DNA-directed RNA polymerase specialized sigma subunit